MAKAEKYRISFASLSGVTCEVQFFFEGYTGAVTNLIGAYRPFILGEFNTDEDLFKPMRPQLATINILASSSGVSIDDFLLDNDTDVDVYFKFYSATQYYWVGRLLQDDFQETWIDTEHIITLRATEGFGYLKEEQLASDTRAELSGTYTMLDLIKYSMFSTRQGFGNKYIIINNLFHNSMTSSNTYHPLDQCKLDAKTFQIEAQTYDSSYDTLEKINRAFNQTIFMYEANWFMMRLEELYTPTTQNLRGVLVNELTGINSLIDKRYDLNVGVGEEMQPITPEMLRFIKRRTKTDTIQFNYDQWDEILCNQTFQRGNNTLNTSTTKEFEVNDWTYYAGTINSPTTPSSGAVRRVETYNATGDLKDNYIYIPVSSTENRYLKSCAIPVLSDETFTFSIETKYKITPNVTPFTDSQYYIILAGVTNNYTLDDDGKWYQSNATWSTNIKSIQVYYDGTNAPISTEWNTVKVESTPIPENGNIYVLLWASSNSTSSQERWFKGINFQYNQSFNGISNNAITAIQSIFTKNENINKNFQDQIFLDDGVSRVYKGTIYESDGVTPTDKQWYRYRYDDERIGFRKSNAIAHWEHNRFNRNKIDANFYGLLWDDGGLTKPIGLMNTIRFLDDDPEKVYAILNLKEIDFSANTWSATLIEVYDDTKDGISTTPVTEVFSANAIGGTYNSITKIPLTLVSPADMTILNNVVVYNGNNAITVNISASVTGTINSKFTGSNTVYLYLKKNSTTIQTASIDVSTLPKSFNVNLSVNSITFNYLDNFYIEVDSGINQIIVTTGQISFNYTTSTPFVYDPYEDKYIYK